jgi:hypothetical protein
MKKYLFVRLFVLGSSAFIFSGASSQLSADRVARLDTHNQSHRNYSAVGADADRMALASMKAVNGKMFNHFSKNYKGASDISISTIGNFTQISFKNEGVSNKVQYNKKGKWMYSIKSYEEARLDQSIRDNVESAYPGYTVFGFVSELRVYDKSATLVMIENKKSWKRIRIIDGNFDVYEEYTKQ